MTNFIGPGPHGAYFSECRKFRYSLWRRWDDNLSFWTCANVEPNADLCCFIGLNPSTADEKLDDPTIRRCIGFAKDWGFNGLVMLNIFAYRATDPKDMKAFPAPEGPLNNLAICTVAGLVGRTVAAWGVHGVHRNRGLWVKPLLLEHHPVCLGLTKGGHPKHPLYLPKNSVPVRF